MPKIFEYLGIIFFFYSNEHEPIHVHARKGEFESKAEFQIVEGRIERIIISSVFGKKPLKNNDLKHFQQTTDRPTGILRRLNSDGWWQTPYGII